MILGNWSCDHPPNNPEIPEREKMKYQKYCPRQVMIYDPGEK